MKAKLYIVGTPIGNRGDLTFRAAEVLRDADIVACEDTRHSRPLLSEIGAKGQLIAYHKFNEAECARKIADYVANGKSVALVTDAGMPGVSDPGYRLIQELKGRGVPFTVLPGPSAVVTALVGSGLPSDAFFFGGFLPVKSGRRSQVLQQALAASYTSIFYESPFRILKSVQEVARLDPQAPICVARELTKVFETYHRGSAEQLAEEFRARPPKGEMVLLIGGVNAPRAAAVSPAEGEQGAQG